LFGAVEQLREVIDAPRAPVEHQRYTELVELIQAALDPATYAAWTLGRKMPIEEAIAFAMSGDET
jgi:hypothetical protein